MYIPAKSIDDLLRKTYSAILKSKVEVTSSKGKSIEIFGIVLELKNPRSRVSRSETRGVLFSCIGEFLWYMSGRDDVEFVKQYVGPKYEEFAEDDGRVHGAYGPRLFKKDGIDQVDFVVKKLRKNDGSRKAVIQLYDARDTLNEDYKDVPCTCTLQFVIRKGRLHMQTHMRSNDAYLGLPHDIFCFTMLQEMLAVTLGAKLGTYKHTVGSLHLYVSDLEDAQKFIREGFHEDRPMPSMPGPSPFDQMKKLIEAEEKIRSGNSEIDASIFDKYWSDFLSLIKIRFEKSSRNIVKIMTSMNDDVYQSYVRKRHRNVIRKESQTLELPLDSNEPGDDSK